MKICLKFISLVFFTVATVFSVAFADDFRYDSKNRRDPFIPEAQIASVEKQLGANQLRLEGIILDPFGNSIAMLNGEIVKENETFAGLKVKKIEANKVTFETKEGETFQVVLSKDEIAMQKYVQSFEGTPTEKATTPEMKADSGNKKPTDQKSDAILSQSETGR